MNAGELTGFVERDPALCQIAREVSLRLADDPAHDLAHCLRVASWTVRFAAGGVEPRLSIAAAPKRCSARRCRTP